jgi:SH3 domain-binding protein 5 (SH3BP5)
LQVLKQSAEDLARALGCSKDRYRMALDALESISDEVHEQRRLMLTLPPRTPGVGAETTDELASWPSTSIGLAFHFEFGDLLLDFVRI